MNFPLRAQNSIDDLQRLGICHGDIFLLSHRHYLAIGSEKVNCLEYQDTEIEKSLWKSRDGFHGLSLFYC